MKLSNFLRYDPSYKGKGLSAGSHLEQEVWDMFSQDLPRLRATADAIAKGATELRSAGVAIDIDSDDEDEEAHEGRVLQTLHKRRERSGGLPRKKKAKVLKSTGALACEVCRFDFKATYGKVGHGFAECHHDKPISTLKPGEKTKLSDLRIVCSNCHRMLHRTRPWLSVDDLRSLLSAKVAP
jgi:5-methylcytosine-specific restriction protein A